MRALLDVSVLLPLFDKGHIFHDRARRWWHQNRQEGWASCPLTQHGYLRVISQPSYPRAVPLSVAMQMLERWAVPPRHEFWTDDLSILDGTLIDRTKLLGPMQITDIYLLALAVKHRGCLVTFDTAITTAAVRGAHKENLLVL